jgi:uridylate kinase
MLAPEAGTGVLKARVLAGPPSQGRDRAAMAVLPTNQVMFTGGHTTTPPFTTTSLAEIYFGP